MLNIDGSYGEGGGQVLRSALGLSLATGTPFQIENIRAGRARPGLLRQHLAAVRTAAAVGRAEVSGDSLGSRALSFAPRALVAGEHHAAIGSAGSAMLVVQAVLPALLVADAPTRLVVEGGTHNPSAPPFDFIASTFGPLLARMGARVRVTLERPGFYPAGGGRVVVEVEPAPLGPLVLVERGAVRSIRARAVVSGLSTRIAHRELHVLRERFGLARDALVCEEIEDPVGPGNVVHVEVVCEHVTETFTAFGEKRVRAEEVATAVADEAQAWIDRDVPVGEHLADQLLLPLALAARAGARGAGPRDGGRFRTGPVTLHTTTNAEVIARFLDVRFTFEPSGEGTLVSCA
ncbi:MAG: RNA 3'-terminal phosphate cyclase [Pseudomonadota bacterium]|nr:RNA 3'-terminal phosphate cyclase [Pseudomonadota bacterium]